MEQIDYTKHYLKWHPQTDDHRLRMVGFYKNLFAKHLGTIELKSALDVGCGVGFAMLACKEMQCSLVKGIEMDRGQCDLARANGLDAELTADSLAFLKQHAGKFDVVLCMDVIEHIDVERQLGFCAALHGALKPGGKFLCTVPNANSPFAARWRYIDWTHRASFTEHSLEFLLHSAGFRGIDIGEMEFLARPNFVWLPLSGARHWWAFKFFRLLRRLEAMAELGPEQGRKIPLSLNILATANAGPGDKTPLK
jgi:SAM-dependent methyltransferase